MPQDKDSYRVRQFISGASLVLSLMLCLGQPAHADDQDRPAKVDLSQSNYKPEYPASALHKGEHGTAIVAVYVNAIGNPYKVELAQTSGYADLDRAAVEAVWKWHFEPTIKNGEAVSDWTAVGIKFDTDGVSAVPASPDTQIAQRDRNRVICKSNVNSTGTNITQPQVCLAKWQWDEQEKSDQKTMRDAIHKASGSSGSPR